MAIIRKENPVNEDELIDVMQVALFDGLVTNGTWTNYESYHRAYKNETPNGIRPEVFTGSGNEYRDVFNDDDFNATSFFLVPDNISVEDDLHTANISIIFQVNLEKIYPTAPHRFDAEMRNEVQTILKNLDGRFNYIDTHTSIDDVYEGLDTEKVNWDDMQKFHVVRFEIEAKYEEECNPTFATSDCTVTVDADMKPETAIGADDGEGKAIVTGAQGNITFAWTGPNGFTSTDQDITGLETGTYFITVSDDNAISCTDTDSGEVAEPPPLPTCNLLIDSIVNTPPSVFGASDGTATVTFSGNVGAASILWDNGDTGTTATNLPSGSICVTILDLAVLGCRQIAKTTLEEGLFVPSSIDNLVVLLEFSDTSSITDSGGAVSEVVNKGSGNNAVQTVSTLKPTTNLNTMNGLNVLNFDDSEGLRIPNLTLSGNFTLIVISKTNNDLFIEHSSIATSNDGFFFNGSGQVVSVYRRTSFVFPVNDPNFLGTGDSFGYVRNNGTTLDYGRSSVTLGSISTATLGTGNVTDTLFIGSRNDTTLFTDGDIAEVALWDKDITSMELANIHAYYVTKFNLTVP